MGKIRKRLDGQDVTAVKTIFILQPKNAETSTTLITQQPLSMRELA
jgi:hypothetical protein